jgi:8-amino-7-oxononanoate synthase
MTRPVAAWARDELARLEQAGLRRSLEALDGPQGPRVSIQGAQLVNFSSNDYLGLCGDPRLAAAAAATLTTHGTGTGASRLLAGNTALHHALESRVARFMDSPTAILFNSGYAANVGILQALCGPGDAIFSDALNHASLIDGCRLSRARVVIYPHGDVAALDRLLAETPARRKLVCTDAVFSMDGDRAPLQDIVASCERHGAGLVVDEAHAIGVVGPQGRGLCAALELTGQVDVRMGTLGKSLGSCGAFAAAAPEIAELLLNRARSLVFSTALPAALCAASLEAIEIVENDDLRRANLWRNIDRFTAVLRSLGLRAEGGSAIFSVVLGSPDAAVEAARRLRARGLLVKPIRPPTVPEGTSRLRISLCATHAAADVERLAEGIASLPELRRAA